MDLDYDRLKAVVIGESDARGWTQTELIERSGISRSTIQRIWKGEPGKPGKKTQRLLEQVFQWESGSVLAVLRGGELTRRSQRSASARHDSTGLNPERTSVSGDASELGRSLIDPNSDDPNIRELSTGPVAGGDEFREQLIRLYLDSLAEEERQARRRAALRVLRLAAASLGMPPEDAELERKLDRLEAIELEIEHEDKPQNSDIAGQRRSTA